MTHLHNSDVLSFLKVHSDNPNVQKFIKEESEYLKSIDIGYSDYLKYLDDNIGDDSPLGTEHLKALLVGKLTVE